MATIALPISFPKFQAIDATGPLASYQVFTYLSGTTTLAPTYNTVDGTGVNTNPVVLDANGEATIMLPVNTIYKFVIVNPLTSVTELTIDPVYAGTQTSGAGDLTLSGNLIIKNFSIEDASAQIYINFSTAGAGAVNGFQVKNATTGTSPSIAAVGADTDVGLALISKGAKHIEVTGGIESIDGKGFYDSNGNLILAETATTTAVNQVTVANATTGTAPGFTATGSDSNIDLNLGGKGTGLPTATQGMKINGIKITAGGAPTTGQVLTLTSSTTAVFQNSTSAPAPTSGQNLLINPLFAVYQDAIHTINTNTPAAVNIADRWMIATPSSSDTNNNTFTPSVQKLTSLLPFLRITNSSGGGSSSSTLLIQTLTALETQVINEILRSKAGSGYFLISGFIRGNATAVSNGATFNVQMQSNTGTTESAALSSIAANNSGWGTAGTVTGLLTPTISTSWQQFSAYISLSVDTFTQLAPYLSLSSGTGSSGGYLEFSAMKLEFAGTSVPSSIPTPFSARPFASELAICQASLAKSFLLGTSPAQNAGTGTNEFIAAAIGSTGTSAFTIGLPVTMRISPAITTYSPAASSAQVYDETAAGACTSIATAGTTGSIFVTCTGNASTVVGHKLGIHYLADARLA